MAAPPTIDSQERRELATVATHWEWALDAAATALDAVAVDLPANTIAEARRELLDERLRTARLLGRVADLRHIDPPPWLPPVRITPRMLGLPDHVRACVLDLEGVLTDSGALHAAAWGDVLDDLLLRRSHETGWQFIPFDREADYRSYFDGRSRLEGIHAFLAERGIHLPDGQPEDGTTTETAFGLAHKKGELLEHGLRESGLAALPGARRYLQAAAYADVARVALSASTTTLPMLQLVGLKHLVDVRIGAETIAAHALRSRPAPDQLLYACRQLAIAPEAVASLTHTGAGVAAALGAGLEVIGVAQGAQADRLRGFGAQHVVPTLQALLDPRLASPQSPISEKAPSWR